MIINGLKNKNGKLMTNVEVVRHTAKVLNYLRNGNNAMDSTTKQKNYMKWLELCGGEEARAQRITDYFNAVANERDDEKAQLMIKNGLIPVKGV